MAVFSVVGLLIAWQFSGFIYNPVFSVALKLLYPFQHYS